MTEEMIYIAGAISNGGKNDARGQYQAVKYGQKYYNKLIKEGFTPFLPHLSYYPWLDDEEETEWTRWLELDLNYIDSSKGLLRLPNDSKGADLEVMYAREIGIPVVHASEDLDVTIKRLTTIFGKPEKRDLTKYLKLMEELKKNVV